VRQRRAANARAQADVTFFHLERAHVLGQASTVQRMRVLVHMLVWAVRHSSLASCSASCCASSAQPRRRIPDSGGHYGGANEGRSCKWCGHESPCNGQAGWSGTCLGQLYSEI